jgi:hypothetical protein
VGCFRLLPEFAPEHFHRRRASQNRVASHPIPSAYKNRAQCETQLASTHIPVTCIPPRKEGSKTNIENLSLAPLEYHRSNCCSLLLVISYLGSAHSEQPTKQKTTKTRKTNLPIHFISSRTFVSIGPFIHSVMLLSNPGSSTTSNSNPVGTPRIQISLSKDQRKSMFAASVTPARGSGKTHSDNSEGSNCNSNSETTNAKKTIHSTIAANPGLYKSVRKALKNQTLNFKINVECK